MKYIYFKSKKGNFGDDLNEWLWPRIFPEVPGNSGTNFFGIGSILKSNNSLIKSCKQEQKIIFGSGVKPSENYSNIKIDSSWDIKFLRGPLSRHALGDKHPYITDAAYALRQTTEFSKIQNVQKKYDVSLMPYFHSLDYFNWERLCRQLGYNYISPLSENGVEHTMQEIAASKKIITEAMHGAIVADIFRVPWSRFILTTPFTEGERIAEFKWTDWLQSVEIYNHEITFIPFYKRNSLHKFVKKISSDKVAVEFLSKRTIEPQIIDKLSNVSTFLLSEDAVIIDIDSKIEAEISKLKNELEIEKYS